MGKISAHLHLVSEPIQQRVYLSIAKLVDSDVGRAVFAMVAFCNFSSEIPGKFLLRTSRLALIV